LDFPFFELICPFAGAPNDIDARQMLVCEVCGESHGSCAPQSDECEKTMASVIKFQCKCCSSSNAIGHDIPLVCEMCGEAGSAHENEAAKPLERVRLKAMHNHTPAACNLEMCRLEPARLLVAKCTSERRKEEKGDEEQGTDKPAQTNDRGRMLAGEEGDQHTHTVTATLYTFSSVLLESGACPLQPASVTSRACCESALVCWSARCQWLSRVQLPTSIQPK